MENIKSFFAREDELSAKPKPVPEAASEIYERPQRIVEKPLPQAKPKLPFSPDELREALKSAPPQTPPAVSVAPDLKAIDRDITHEISAFESALKDVPETVKTKTPEQPKLSAPASRPAPLDPEIMQELEANPLFFNEFSQFLTRENLEAEGVLGQDILFRMKEFHRHRQEGKEYYLYSKDLQTAVQRKIEELKHLEQEWFAKRAQLDEIEKGMHTVEHDIEARTTELKTLVHQANKKSKFEHKVPEGYEFVLKDGRKLSSLLDLKVALHTMPDTVFGHHVTSHKNDFAIWIRGAMNDPQVADQVQEIHDKQQLEVFLAKMGS